MSEYIPRPLADALLQAKRKIVVLEGARAVGKTMMMRQQLAASGFAYETLADQNTYELAREDLHGWLGGLTLPVIIDEAQRIAELPLEIKEIADALPSGQTQFLLTGSAIINRGGLDGQDPLARRSQHFIMSPLTQRELRGIPTSLVDDLWEGEPNTDYEESISRADLYDLMAAGGFPEYCAEYAQYSEWEREKLVSDDIRAVLGDTILPDEKLDVVIAQSILEKLLCTPGGILNASALGNELALDRRTIDRYIGIFMRRFLIHALPNIRTTPNRQTFTRAKIHPVDTSLSIQTMLSKGRDPQSNPVDYGNLLESFVVNQIVPSVQWSNAHPDCFYWRESGSHPKEVDLVMSRRNRLVGVEVKSSSKVAREDFKGLADLAKDERFHRGYLIYTGSRIMKWPGNLWAVPISALWSSDAFVGA
ncbi:ATPase AAA [Bifidobacterium lemurum]|uniref:ATPase AAA n=1 Tax=Bifidobacterium lemurum TaxID=1603886 RepID=A0A261FSU1_9BIFI|nr:AAA family ATPase [Bifidobacterium lemurum]OZG62045.1 ATPase AAA [Bifidobacterium lemurum]QOL34876.1 ATP-binding protein [Bifidobacterium lemurum]